MVIYVENNINCRTLYLIYKCVFLILSLIIPQIRLFIFYSQCFSGLNVIFALKVFVVGPKIFLGSMFFLKLLKCINVASLLCSVKFDC